MIALNAYLPVILLVLGILYLPSIIAIIIGINKLRKKKKAAKYYFIFAGIYLIIGIGLCTM